MDSNNEIKEIYIKNSTWWHITIEDFDPDNILIDEKW